MIHLREVLTHLNAIASSNNWKLYYRLQPTYKAVGHNWKKITAFLQDPRKKNVRSKPGVSKSD